IFIDYLLTVDKLNWSIRNSSRMTYLHVAANRGYTSVVKLALEKCPQLCNRKCENGRTAIEYALMSSNLPDAVIIDIVQTLVVAGTDINSRNYMGFRAIDCAVQHCSAEVIIEMIKLGADITSD